MKDKKLQKMLKLADIKPINENKNVLSSVELLKKAADNKTYAIVRENRKYYIKVTEKTENLTENDFDYIGGVKNKPKYAYNSFSDATRNMNFMFEEINRLNDGESVNVLESDVDLLDEKKYVLKSKKKSAPAPEPELDFGSEEKGGGDEEFDFGGDDEFDFGDSEGGDDEGDLDFDSEDEDLEDEDDPIKDIQKTTGKLGQKLRDTEDISPDMSKWVAKSVLAALDLDNMEKSDKKDLIKTIKKGGKSEDEENNVGNGDDLDLDIDIEEDYDNYMDDDMERQYNGVDMALNVYDNLPISDVDMPIQDKAYLNIDQDVLTSTDLYGPNDEYDSYMDEDDDEGMCDHCSGTGCSHCAGLGYHDVPMSDVDMPIQDKAYLNIDDPTVTNPYDSYMNDEEDYAKSYADKDIRSHYHNPSFDEMERTHALDYDTFEVNDCTNCDGAGCPECGFNHNMMGDMRFIEDDLETGRGGERYNTDEILYDSYMEDDMFEEDTFMTIEDELGLPPATPEMDETDYEHTPAMMESKKRRKALTEDHLDKDMNSKEQLDAYYELETTIKDMNKGSEDEYTYIVEFSREDGDNIYLNVIEEPTGVKISEYMIDIDGNIMETGDDRYADEVVGDVDFVEENDDNWVKDEDMEMNDSPAPAKEPKTKPAPTKEPDTDKPARPSRRPFTPPPHIRPGEEPRPKAGRDDDSDVEFE